MKIIQLLFIGYTYAGCRTQRSSGINCNRFKSITSFRTVEGTCNNLRKVIWGATNIPMRRLMCKFYNYKNNVVGLNLVNFCQCIMKLDCYFINREKYQISLLLKLLLI